MFSFNSQLAAKEVQLFLPLQLFYNVQRLGEHKVWWELRFSGILCSVTACLKTLWQCATSQKKGVRNCTALIASKLVKVLLLGQNLKKLNLQNFILVHWFWPYFEASECTVQAVLKVVNFWMKAFSWFGLGVDIYGVPMY